MTENNDATHEHVQGMLAGYTAGSVNTAERDVIAAHVADCVECGNELAGWQAIRTGVRQAAPAVTAPGREVVTTVLERARAEATTPSAGKFPVMRSALRHAAALLAGQLPLVQRRLWLASALVMALGGGLAAAGTRDAAGVVLAFIAPVVAAAGLAVIYSPRVDPHLEVALASPTSPRTVLLARLTLVFGYDLVLGLATSAALSWTGAAGQVWTIVSAWLGPMSLLSAVSLAVAVWRGPNVAMATAMTLWAAGLCTTLPTVHLAGILRSVSETLWSTNAVTLGGAALIVIGTLVVAPRRTQPHAVLE